MAKSKKQKMSTLTFVALLSKTGTSAPVIDTVFEDTIGITQSNISRASAGNYRITKVGAFPANKTFCPPFQTQLGDGNSVWLPYYYNLLNKMLYYQIYRIDDDTLEITFIDGETFGSIEFPSFFPVEIRVYP